MSLHYPEQDQILRIMSIDPGTDTLGWAITDLNLVTLDAVVLEVVTENASWLVRRHDMYQEIEYWHGSRPARLQALSDALLAQMRYWQPSLLASESPFMGRRANAYEALVEALMMLRQTYAAYEAHRALELVTPPEAKKAVGVQHKDRGNKNATKDCLQAILRNPNTYQLYYQASTPFEALDEHSIDALSVGYAKVVEARAFLRNQGG